MTAAVLLDANLLVALVHAVHVHHAGAQRWMGSRDRGSRWASCALTQLAFVRLGAMSQIGGPEASPARSLALLRAMVADPRHDYWDEAPSPLDLRSLQGPALAGHRQITDAYLLGLAAARHACIATFDRGLRSFAEAEGLGEHVEWIGPVPAAHQPSARYVARRAKLARAR